MPWKVYPWPITEIRNSTDVFAMLQPAAAGDLAELCYSDCCPEICHPRHRLSYTSQIVHATKMILICLTKLASHCISSISRQKLESRAKAWLHVRTSSWSHNTSGTPRAPDTKMERQSSSIQCIGVLTSFPKNRAYQLLNQSQNFFDF